MLGASYEPPMPASALMHSLFGLILFVVGAYLSYSRHHIDYLSFSMAAVFFVISGISYKQFRNACLTC